jgi:hypothetical protein
LDIADFDLCIEIVSAAGTGMTLQQYTMAALTVLPKKYVPIGLTIIAYAQFLGGTLLVSVCQTVLVNTLTFKLSESLPGFDVLAIKSAGATQIRGLVSERDLPVILAAYNTGINNTFYFALAASFIAFVASLFMEWKSVKDKGIDSEEV